MSRSGSGLSFTSSAVVAATSGHAADAGRLDGRLRRPIHLALPLNREVGCNLPLALLDSE